MQKDWADVAADRCFSAIRSRGGFDIDVGPDIEDEIREELAQIIRAAASPQDGAVAEFSEGS